MRDREKRASCSLFPMPFPTTSTRQSGSQLSAPVFSSLIPICKGLWAALAALLAPHLPDDSPQSSSHKRCFFLPPPPCFQYQRLTGSCVASEEYHWFVFVFRDPYSFIPQVLPSLLLSFIFAQLVTHIQLLLRSSYLFSSISLVSSCLLSTVHANKTPSGETLHLPR